MNRIFTAIALCLTWGASAQITITENDLPSAGTSYPVAQGNLINDFDFSLTGAGYTWDYSELEIQSTDTTNMVSVSNAPFMYQFLFNSPFDPDHQADFGSTADDVDLGGMLTLEDMFVFFKKTSTAYSQVGTGTTVNGIPLPAVNEPVDVIFNEPMNYNNVDSSYSEWMISVPNTATYKLKQWRTATADGWGTLITPQGTFEALRIRMDLEALDSIAIDLLGLDFETPRTWTEYHWYGVDGGIPLLQVNENLGFTSSITFQYVDDTKPTDVASWYANDLVIYPNPARETMWVDMPAHMKEQVTDVRIIDNQGREVKAFTASALNRGFDVSELSSGRYTLLFLNNDQVLSDHGIVVE